MKVILKATFLTAVLAASVNLAHSEPTNTPHYSKAEIKQMVHEAHTTQQYRTLADYFRGQQRKFDQEARSEKQEWERRSQNTTGLAQKYPRPVDSSKNRYEYFSYEAEDMSQQANRYETLAAKAQ
jgi:hypothetical protein